MTSLMFPAPFLATALKVEMGEAELGASRNGFRGPDPLCRSLMYRKGVLMELKRTDRLMRADEVAEIIRKNPWLRKNHVPSFYRSNPEVCLSMP